MGIYVLRVRSQANYVNSLPICLEDAAIEALFPSSPLTISVDASVVFACVKMNSTLGSSDKARNGIVDLPTQYKWLHISFYPFIAIDDSRCFDFDGQTCFLSDRSDCLRPSFLLPLPPLRKWP